MENNGKGKAVFIGSEEEEFDKVLRTYYLNDLLLDGFGAESIDVYGSYRQIPKELRTQILTYLRKQYGYYEALLGDEKEEKEEEEEKQETLDTGSPKFDELEQRISHLEVVLNHLKAKKDKKEKEMKKRKKKGDGEGSGSNY